MRKENQNVQEPKVVEMPPGWELEREHELIRHDNGEQSPREGWGEKQEHDRDQKRRQREYEPIDIQSLFTRPPTYSNHALLELSPVSILDLDSSSPRRGLSPELYIGYEPGQKTVDVIAGVVATHDIDQRPSSSSENKEQKEMQYASSGKENNSIFAAVTDSNPDLVLKIERDLGLESRVLKSAPVSPSTPQCVVDPHKTDIKVRGDDDIFSGSTRRRSLSFPNGRILGSGRFRTDAEPCIGQDVKQELKRGRSYTRFDTRHQNDESGSRNFELPKKYNQGEMPFSKGLLNLTKELYATAVSTERVRDQDKEEVDSFGQSSCRVEERHENQERVGNKNTQRIKRQKARRRERERALRNETPEQDTVTGLERDHDRVGNANTQRIKRQKARKREREKAMRQEEMLERGTSTRPERDHDYDQNSEVLGARLVLRRGGKDTRFDETIVWYRIKEECSSDWRIQEYREFRENIEYGEHQESSMSTSDLDRGELFGGPGDTNIDMNGDSSDNSKHRFENEGHRDPSVKNSFVNCEKGIHGAGDEKENEKGSIARDPRSFLRVNTHDRNKVPLKGECIDTDAENADEWKMLIGVQNCDCDVTGICSGKHAICQCDSEVTASKIFNSDHDEKSDSITGLEDSRREEKSSDFIDASCACDTGFGRNEESETTLVSLPSLTSKNCLSVFSRLDTPIIDPKEMKTQDCCANASRVHLAPASLDSVGYVSNDRNNKLNKEDSFNSRAGQSGSKYCACPSSMCYHSQRSFEYPLYTPLSSLGTSIQQYHHLRTQHNQAVSKQNINLTSSQYYQLARALDTSSSQSLVVSKLSPQRIGITTNQTFVNLRNTKPSASLRVDEADERKQEGLHPKAPKQEIKKEDFKPYCSGRTFRKWSRLIQQEFPRPSSQYNEAWYIRTIEEANMRLGQLLERGHNDQYENMYGEDLLNGEDSSRDSIGDMWLTDYMNMATNVETETKSKEHLEASPKIKGLIGLDLEWCPGSTKTALVQVAARDTVLVIQLCTMRELPSRLIEILEDECILKAGVGILGDAVRLYSEFSVPTYSCVELSYLARYVEGGEWPGQPCDLISLARLVHTYEDAALPKGWETTSNWEAELSPNQIKYAANDAYAGYLIARRLLERAKNKNIEPKLYMFNVIRGRPKDRDGGPWLLPKSDPECVVSPLPTSNSSACPTDSVETSNSSFSSERIGSARTKHNNTNITSLHNQFLSI